MIIDQLEKLFNSLLLKHVKIYTDEEVIRNGQIANFSIKNHIIKLSIENEKTTKIVELFFPYEILQRKDTKIYILDYNVNKIKLTKENSKTRDDIVSLLFDEEISNKILNKKLYIEITNA